MDAKVDRSSKLQNLPFDCLYHIFRYLSLKDKLNFSKVCSEWIDLDSSIGQVSEFAVKSYFHDIFYGDEDIQYMPKRTINLQEFREIMMNWGSILKKFCILLAYANEKMKHSVSVVYVFDAIAYELDGDIDYETIMDIVVQNCHDLRKLEIRVWGDHANLAEKFHALFLVNPKLTDLKLDVSDDVNLNKIIRLEDASRPVKNLYLDLHARTSIRTVNDLSELLKSGNVNLKELRVEQVKSKDILNLMPVIANYARELQVLHFIFDYESTDSEMFSAFEKLSVFENLEDLSIELRSTHIKAEVYSSINNCRKLKKIGLRGPGVTDESLRTLMTALPNLGPVTLLYAGLHSVARPNLQYNLRSLKLYEYSNLSEDGLKKISLLTNLEELSIRETYDHTIMTDNVITEITFGCQNLKKVTIHGCKKITGDGINTLVTAIPNLESVVLLYLAIDSIVQSNAQSRIRSLELDDCCGVKNDEFEKIVVFENLKELRIGNLHGLTDKAFFEISSACKQLTKVTLDDVGGITNKAVYALVSTLPKLEYLELRALDITSILPEDFQPLNLRRLKVSDCRKLPEDTLERLITQIPEMENILTWTIDVWNAQNASYNSV